MPVRTPVELFPIGVQLVHDELRVKQAVGAHRGGVERRGDERRRAAIFRHVTHSVAAARCLAQTVMAAWYDGVLARLGDGAGAWPPAHEDAVQEPFRYLDANPGKEIRSRLMDAFNVWLQVPDDALQQVTHIVRRLHTASLLVDDVEDGSDLRRGLPTAHTIFGVAQTINTANYVYFQVFAEILRLPPGDSEVQRLVADELVRLHRGQGMDLYWRDALVCPTEQEYVDMVLNKTGGLFRIAIKLMLAQRSVREVPDMIPLVNLIGILFQIRDDYVNLQDARLAQHKGYCEDLTEGKFSFPILHAVRGGAAHSAAASAPRPGDRMLHILRQRTTNLETKQYAVRYMDEVTGSFAYTRAVMRQLHAQAQAEVSRIEGVLGVANPPLHGILAALETDV